MRWSPWRGCHKISEGCRFCYIHKGDSKRGVQTNHIVKTSEFYKPIEKDKNGQYKIKSDTVIYVCFNSDFLIEEADQWRLECYQMMKERADLHFVFLTKRIDRFSNILPQDWNDGYENITVGVSIENQKNADKRLIILSKLPIRHKNIICQPLIEKINIEPYLEGIELVVVGGESDKNARPLDYKWVLYLREQCQKHQTNFYFRQCGTHFIKDDTYYTIPTKLLTSQARKANINLKYE